MPGRANIKRFFQSAEITGTGSEIDTPHGLGYVPRSVITSFTEGDGTDDIAYGTHDNVDVKITASSGAKYRVTAW